MRFDRVLRSFTSRTGAELCGSLDFAVQEQPQEGQTMSRPKIDQVARARRAWRRLARIARLHGRVTYRDLAAQLGLHHRAASHFLGVIQNHCRRQGVPPLQALAVNSRTNVPGLGYIASARSGAAYERTLKRVYAHHWPLTAPF